MEELVSSGKIDAYMKTTILEMIRITAEHLAKNHEKLRKGVTDIMGGKVLNYPARETYYTGFRAGILQGEVNGEIKGQTKKGMICYLNAITRGMSHRDALAIADITEGEAATALSLRKEGKL